MNLIAIGDIHGCSDQLGGLLEIIPVDRMTWIVFLGDYVDIGPGSRRVIEKLLEIRDTHTRSVFIRGNHDQLLLEYLAHGDLIKYSKYGGLTTIQSYLSAPFGNVHTQLVQEFPAQHLDFLKSLKTYWELDHTLFSHAGLLPASPQDRSPENMLGRSHADLFDWSEKCELLSVCGHYFSSNGQIKFGTNVVCLDTGCGVKAGPLTAISFGTTTAYQIWQSGERKCFKIHAPADIERKIDRLVAGLSILEQSTSSGSSK